MVYVEKPNKIEPINLLFTQSSKDILNTLISMPLNTSSVQF